MAANKTEAARVEHEASEFYRFGFDEVFPVSAEQGIGLGDLLDALVEDLKEIPKQAKAEADLNLKFARFDLRSWGGQMLASLLC